MMHKIRTNRSMASAACWALLVAGTAAATGQDKPAPQLGGVSPEAISQADFKAEIQPLLQKFCVKCHNADNMESGIRVDQLTGAAEDRFIPLWKGIQQQLDEEAMPPSAEPQPTAQQRKAFSRWIGNNIKLARMRETQRNGSVRRLTVAQYRNTLRDLLGLQEDLTDTLPPDGLSKDGFANNGQALLLLPLQVETYFDIAEKALNLCIVDERQKPVVQNFRMDLGLSINPEPCPDKLVLGALNALLNNADFMVTELKPTKPFEYQPFAMRTKYEFIEGYAGNDTVRGWRKFDSIYHSVFACMRGSPGYPKGEAYQTAPGGLLLRPAIPSPEIFGQASTYGPMANFKISLRELPEQGNFRVTVKAARYNDGLLLDQGAAPPAEGLNGVIVADLKAGTEVTLNVPKAGVYQIDALTSVGKSRSNLTLELGDRIITGQLFEASTKPAGKDEQQPDHRTPFLAVRLPAGELKLKVKFGDSSRLKALTFTPLDDSSELARRFQTFEQRAPSLGVYVGLRRDCGSTLTQVGMPVQVPNTELQSFVFEGAINDFPTPDVEKDNVNYLAGIREIGVRSEYTDGRDMPRLVVRSVEFEGPYYDTWPPETHRRIFADSPLKNDPAAYAREVIRSFATRAYRRPLTPAELNPLVDVWKASFAAKSDFQQSIKDALLVVLTSPQFLFLIENSSSPAAEPLDSHELASKLSYFLWNAPPDERLLTLAGKGLLHQSLDSEIDRLVQDPRFGQFINEFAAQWLSLDKFEVVATDAKRYPKLTRDTKTQLRREPVEFVRYLIEQNLPVRNLIQSDFVVANEVVASYYDLADRTETGFRFVPIKHENSNLGGVLTQASILAGLSDGRESNPIKRGAWLARKIIAEAPEDPPPNVPQLKEDDTDKLTLREKLERHRNQKGCVKCHTGIDPWGVPFESFDAGGLLKNTVVDARSTLPDGKDVRDLKDLRQYLANDRIDQVAFSFLKHSATYATGRTLTYNEQTWLQEQSLKMKTTEYRMQDLIRFVIKSDLFMKK